MLIFLQFCILNQQITHIMDSNKIVKISKRLSYVLRHDPQKLGLSLDAQGWVSVDALLNAFSSHFFLRF